MAVTLNLAIRVLLELAEAHLAFVWPEAEARASDEPWATSPRLIDPHLLRAARNELMSKGQITRTIEATRGGREIATYHPADMARRARAVSDAAARKRLVYTRYRTWAEGTEADPGGIIGPAAERILHASLRDASPAIGYQIENPDDGQTSKVLGLDVASGPLDNAAHLYLGNPPIRVTLVFESKSRRQHLYHDSSSLYQVLYKAAELQVAEPNAHIIPVLVCRRAHITAFRLFKDLGAYIIDARGQWVLPHVRVTDEEVLEVRNELNFLDLHRTAPPWIDHRIRDHLVTHLPGVALRQAERWRAAGCHFSDQYWNLWTDESLTNLAEIRQEMKDYDWFEGGW